MSAANIQTRPRAQSFLHIDVILLGAGASSRMQGLDKLLKGIHGEPLLRRSARTARDANVKDVYVVLPPDNPARRASLSGLDVKPIDAPDWREGMAASIRAGMGELSNRTDAVIIALADMPDITSDHLNSLITAFDPSRSQEICRPVSANGTPGHPVLFGRRFFASLSAIGGDHGGRDIVRAAPDYVFDVKTPGHSVTVDLDTPEDWLEWHAGTSGN